MNTIVWLNLVFYYQCSIVLVSNDTKSETSDTFSNTNYPITQIHHSSDTNYSGTLKISIKI